MAKTVIADIRNNQFPALEVEEGTFVVWRNLDPYAHSAETLRSSAAYFSAGALLPGEASSPVLFARTGSFAYVCRYHHAMTGVVKVMPRGASHREDGEHGGDGGHGDHAGHGDHGRMQHLHGFVTGGRSARRMFLTHTPVLADERHNYQVILQASLPSQAHADAYDRMRARYGDGKVQIFHDHVALPDIGAGKVTEMPHSAFEYYPSDPEGVRGGEAVPGLEENIPVRIDRVLHFHQFRTEEDYPEALTYLMYGDADDVFIDHYMDRAPSFHSVAKLKSRPTFFAGNGGVVRISVPGKAIRDVPAKVLRRVSMVDNSYHLFWLPPPGVYPNPGMPSSSPGDPLFNRDGTAPAHDVMAESGELETIEIGRFLHYDVRLLNYGVLIV
jgi:hypothetical protein